MLLKDHCLFVAPVYRYQHSRHLVNALNMFADQEADLPEGWEKKLNQQGKVHFSALTKYSTCTYTQPNF